MGKKVKSTQKGGRSQDGEGQPPEESRREEDGNADTTERQSGGASAIRCRGESNKGQ